MSWGEASSVELKQWCDEQKARLEALMSKNDDAVDLKQWCDEKKAHLEALMAPGVPPGVPRGRVWGYPLRGGAWGLSF